MQCVCVFSCFFVFFFCSKIHAEITPYVCIKTIVHSSHLLEPLWAIRFTGSNSNKQESYQCQIVGQIPLLCCVGLNSTNICSFFRAVSVNVSHFHWIWPRHDIIHSRLLLHQTTHSDSQLQYVGSQGLELLFNMVMFSTRNNNKMQCITYYILQVVGYQ